MTRWKDVPVGSTVLLRGKRWTLVSLEKAEDGLAVVVKSKGQTARTTVGKKDEVELVAFSTKIRVEEAVEARREKKKKRLGEKLTKPTFEVEPSGWTGTPRGDAPEKAIRAILGAELVGVQLGDDEAYTVPLIDVSTLSSHLFLFHGIGPVDVLKEGGFADALAIHSAEHEAGHAEPKIPHFHDADRPMVARSPRFR